MIEESSSLFASPRTPIGYRYARRASMGETSTMNSTTTDEISSPPMSASSRRHARRGWKGPALSVTSDSPYTSRKAREQVLDASQHRRSCIFNSLSDALILEPPSCGGDEVILSSSQRSNNSSSSSHHHPRYQRRGSTTSSTGGTPSSPGVLLRQPSAYRTLDGQAQPKSTTTTVDARPIPMASSSGAAAAATIIAPTTTKTPRRASRRNSRRERSDDTHQNHDGSDHSRRSISSSILLEQDHPSTLESSPSSSPTKQPKQRRGGKRTTTTGPSRSLSPHALRHLVATPRTAAKKTLARVSDHIKRSFGASSEHKRGTPTTTTGTTGTIDDRPIPYYSSSGTPASSSYNDQTDDHSSVASFGGDDPHGGGCSGDHPSFSMESSTRSTQPQPRRGSIYATQQHINISSLPPKSPRSSSSSSSPSKSTRRYSMSSSFSPTKSPHKTKKTGGNNIIWCQKKQPTGKSEDRRGTPDTSPATSANSRKQPTTFVLPNRMPLD